MSLVKKALVSAVLGSVCVALAACGSIPFLGDSSGGSAAVAPSKAATATKSATATGTAAATSTASAVATTPATPHYKFASSKHPAPADPVLMSGNWGYRKVPAFEQSSKTTTETYATLEQIENDKLKADQTKKLLATFKKSPKIRQLIDKSGGDWTEARWGVAQCIVWDEAPVDTPWVQAVLVAEFKTDGGVKAVVCTVYRQHTRYGFDNTPLVAGTEVGYTDTGYTPFDNPKFIRLK